jgi:hypothetical protein
MLKITVRHNSHKPSPGKHIEVNLEKETFSMFKQRCSDLLGIKAAKVYNHYGTQVNMLPDMQSNEVYFISEVGFITLSQLLG